MVLLIELIDAQEMAPCCSTPSHCDIYAWAFFLLLLLLLLLLLASLGYV